MIVFSSYTISFQIPGVIGMVTDGGGSEGVIALVIGSDRFFVVRWLLSKLGGYGNGDEGVIDVSFLWLQLTRGIGSELLR